MDKENYTPSRPLQHPEDAEKIAAIRWVRVRAAETAACCILYRCGVTFAELCSNSRDTHIHNARTLFIAALNEEIGWNIRGLSQLLQKPETYIIGAVKGYDKNATEGQKFVVSDIINNVENALNY